MDSLGLSNFCTNGFERVVSWPHFGHVSTIDFSFCMGNIAKLHFAQNIMSNNDRIAFVQPDVHLTLTYFGETPRPP